MFISPYIKNFPQIVKEKKRLFKTFLTKIENGTFPSYGKVEMIAPSIQPDVWKEIDCKECARCCKKMTPTFKKNEIKIIAKHFGMTTQKFIDKWLYKDRKGDWLNKKTPCQFLGKDNLCTIYDIRPKDCSGFPHLQKAPLKFYAHALKQNIEYCPATLLFVEKLKERIEQAYK